jgi:hypothetical protein
MCTKTLWLGQETFTKKFIKLKNFYSYKGIVMRLTRRGSFVKHFVLSVSILLAIAVNLVGYSVANPYALIGEVPPDQETYPPVITITSPVNNTAYNTSRVSLTFNVTAPQSRTASSTTVIRVSYEDDWRNEVIDVLLGGQEQPSFNLQLSNVPEGQHSILIKAVGYGLYKQEEQWFYKWFYIRSSATICFTIDRTAPTVLVLPPENLSSTSTVPLNFMVNEAYSQAAYSLNGQENVTVSGNSTIPNLPAGQYNVTFYAWDTAGNSGASQTANFTVAEMPQMAETADNSLIVSAAVVLSTAVIIGVVLFLRRRHSASKFY